MSAHLNIFDAIVLSIIGLSCLFAFFRGLVKEILSLAAWIGAGIVTIYYFPMVAEKLEAHFKSPTVAAGVSAVGLYIAALISFGIINMIIFKTVKSGGESGMLDNLLGLAFGAFRGALIVSLGYALIMFVLAGKEPPDWLKNSVTKPYAEKGAQLLAKIAPEYMHDMSALEKKASTELKAADSKEPPADEPVGQSENGSGYSRTSNSEMNRLIDSTGQSQ